MPLYDVPFNTANARRPYKQDGIDKFVRVCDTALGRSQHQDPIGSLALGIHAVHAHFTNY
jgi:hypothetical protein